MRILLKFWATFKEENTTLCLTPEAIDIKHIRADASDRDFEKSLPLSGLEQQPFFLRESVANPAAANLRPSGFATAKALYIVFMHFAHEPLFLAFR